VSHQGRTGGFKVLRYTDARGHTCAFYDSTLLFPKDAATLPGVFDLYDVRTDCRHARLLSSTPAAILGHESGWSPDGLTFYASSTSGQTLVALDLTDPRSTSSPTTR
jgi:hypothetical protein